MDPSSQIKILLIMTGRRICQAETGGRGMIPLVRPPFHQGRWALCDGVFVAQDTPYDKVFLAGLW